MKEKKDMKKFLFVFLTIISSVFVVLTTVTIIMPGWMSYIVGNYTCKDINTNFNEINIDKNLIPNGYELQGIGTKISVKEKYENVDLKEIKTKIFKNDNESIIIQEPITFNLEDYLKDYSLKNSDKYFPELQKKYNIKLNNWFDLKYLEAKVTNKDFSLYNNKQNIFVAKSLQVKTIIPVLKNEADYIYNEKFKGFLNYDDGNLSLFQFYNPNDLNTEYQMIFSNEFSKDEMIEIISTLEFVS
jgi:hypothetical protein